MADEPKKPQDDGQRDAKGRFGVGNPGGTGRKRIDPVVRDMLEAATPHAAKRLIEALDATMVVHHQGVEVGEYVDHDKRLRAIEAILNRLYGKPVQQIGSEDGGPAVVAVDLAALLERLA